MKIKLHLAITNPEKFLKGDWDCFNLFANNDFYADHWIKAGEVEFEVDMDSAMVVQRATSALDAEMGKLSAAMNVLEQRKAELLALPELS